MPASVDLLDVNVWLALTLADHPHHRRARRYWFEEAAAEIAFCRITSLAFLRLCTQPRVMAGNPLTTAEAWMAYHAFRELPEVVLWAKAADCEEGLRTWAQDQAAAPRLWPDAYLAAFARTAGLRMVTFDKDFTCMSDLDLLYLGEDPS